MFHHVEGTVTVESRLVSPHLHTDPLRDPRRTRTPRPIGGRSLTSP
jgi:hypothetical protein